MTTDAIEQLSTMLGNPRPRATCPICGEFVSDDDKLRVRGLVANYVPMGHMVDALRIMRVNHGVDGERVTGVLVDVCKPCLVDLLAEVTTR